eukprot:Skav228555  [mRNA]  locus=scaffold1887:647093:652451:- [translate_table: standard]
MAPFVGPNELLQRLERLEKVVEEHGRRLEDLAPKGLRRGGVSRRSSRSPPRGGAPLNDKAPRAVAFANDVAPGTAPQRTSSVAWRTNDRAVPLPNFERFDPELGVWEKLPPMPTARHGAACCPVAGLVYALAGFDGQTVLSSAERFDAARRGTVRMGGSDDSHEVGAFEEFNPSTWQWQAPSARAELPTPRGGLAMAVSTSSTGAGLVLAIGGRRTNGEKLDVVECALDQR